MHAAESYGPLDLTVIVLTYNQSLTTAMVLRSLEEQDFAGDFEVIVYR